MRTATLALLTVLLALTALPACRGPMPDMRFYTLTPQARPTAAAAPAAVGVGPLVIPLALDRPQIVTRTAENQLSMAEFHRWGGSLSGDVLAAVTQDLSALLGSDRVVAHPWTRFIEPEFRVPLEIHRFDGTLGGDVTLVATWAVQRNGEPAPRVVRKSSFTEPAAGTDYAGLVAAHSRALAALSQEIAAELARQMAGE
ncbi:MAG: PqiC family protein [Thermodesulfobacteriota bacterium]